MSIERKLASIQKILSVEPHPNADKMEIATVLGWRVCVKKGEFKAGDWCVYCEVDSIMPDRPEYEFLRNKDFRIKTIRLRGTFSQGICFPIVITDRLEADGNQVICAALPGNDTPCTIGEGMDVTDYIGVKKYEPPVPKCQEAKSNFPQWLIKTDQTRIQAVPGLIERWQGKTFTVTEKLDGSSMTVYLKDGEFGVCSRNLDLKDGNNPWWDAARLYKLEERMRHMGLNIALQGEVLINGNWYKPGTLDFMMFDIYDIDKLCYYSHKELEERAAVFGVSTVPNLGTYTFDKDTTVDKLVAMATRKSTIVPDRWLEGLVFNGIPEERDQELGRLSFKVINPEYDLAH
jgi:RNA ligase (TIGR02306 family)